MITTQNRDGIPASIAEEQRFFELYKYDKEALPNGWNTPSTWKTLDDIPEGRPFGYVTGHGDSRLVVDYDHVINNGKVTPWIKDVVLRLRKTCATYFETSMSGTGYHQIVDLGDYADSFAPESNSYENIIVDMPIDQYRALSKEEQAKIPKIEFWFKTEGRYVFLTGEHKVMNEVAINEDAAAFFRELLLIRKEMHEKHGSTSGNEDLQGVKFDIDDQTRALTLKALPYISADCSREMWIHVGIALHHCGFPFEVWDTWSQYKDQRTGEASDKYVEGETEKIWKSFANNKSHWNAGTIIAAAKRNGFVINRTGPRYDLNNLTLEENTPRANASNRTAQGSNNNLPELTESEAIRFSLKNTKPIQFVTNMDGSISKSSFSNYVMAIDGDAYLDGRIRFNAFDGRITFTGFYWDAKPHPARDADIANLRYYVDKLYALNNKANLLEAITKISCDHPFHPVREYLGRLTWDGTPRISELLPKYLGAERSEYTTAVTKLMLYGAIQRVTNPGCKFDYCIILADHLQGTGKSTLCRFLALNDEWYTDSVGNLNDNKSVFELMRGKWIIELGEMLAVRKSQDVETIKAFISRQSQDYRQPYGTFAENHPRQCIFIGTSNRPQFLPEDKTGNRRFLPIICNGDNAEIHPLTNESETREYVRQCYAEALTIGAEEGFSLVLDAKFSDELQRIQESATPEDTWIGMIQEYLDETDLTMVCTRLIWDSVFAGDNDREPKRYELNDIAEIMELHIDGWERYKGKNGANGRAKYKFKVYGTQNAWQRVGGKRAERFFEGDRTRHEGLNTLPAMTKELILRHDEKVASGVASGVASISEAGFESVGEDEKLPFE